SIFAFVLNCGGSSYDRPDFFSDDNSQDGPTAQTDDTRICPADAQSKIHQPKSKMKKLPLYWIDAFTDKVFAGNPAGVVPLTEWLPDALMQKIAFENGLAETAFFVKTTE